MPPATVAEFTLGINGGPDNYDGEQQFGPLACEHRLTPDHPVSLVDGYNLPLRIDNNKGCHVADCPVDLGPNCKPIWALQTHLRRTHLSTTQVPRS